MPECPDVRSVGTLKQLIRILISLHNECISRDLRSGAVVFNLYSAFQFKRTSGLIPISYFNHSYSLF